MLRRGGRRDLLDDEDLDDVPRLDVVEALEADAALEPGLHLRHVVLEAAERGDLALEDDNVIPEEPPRVAQRFNCNARHDFVILAESAQDLRSWGQEMRELLEMCVGKAPEPAGAAETLEEAPAAQP